MEMTIKDAERLKRWKKFHPDRYWEYLRSMGNLTVDGVIKLGSYEGINGCWKNQPCFVIAGSQALNGIDLDKLENMHTITVNHLIEDWDKSEFHLFLDERFLQKTTYDLTKYQGTFFQQNSTSTIKGVKKTVRFLGRQTKSPVSTSIASGLYRCQSGIAALNLAIITGANPIYLIGHDSTNGDKSKGGHYKINYTGSKPRTKEEINSYEKRIKDFYKLFLAYKDRIINICDPEKSTTLKGYFKTIPFEVIILPEKKVAIKSESFTGIKTYLYKYPVNYEKKIICSRHNSSFACQAFVKEMKVKYPDIEIKEVFNATDEQNAYELSQCSIYPISYNTNDDDFDKTIIEAMASGLSIIVLNNNKNKIVKVLNGSGIICNTLEEFKIKLEGLLNNVSDRIRYSELAKKQALKYENQSAIDEVIK